MILNSIYARDRPCASSAPPCAVRSKEMVDVAEGADASDHQRLVFGARCAITCLLTFNVDLRLSTCTQQGAAYESRPAGIRDRKHRQPRGHRAQGRGARIRLDVHSRASDNPDSSSDSLSLG